MMKSINQTNVTFDKHVPHEARDLVLRILRKDQTKRLAIREIMNHSFLKKYDYRVNYNDSIGITNVPMSHRERSKENGSKNKDSKREKLEDYGGNALKVVNNNVGNLHQNSKDENSSCQQQNHLQLYNEKEEY